MDLKTMRCSRCKSWVTPDLAACPQCAAPVVRLPTGAALVEGHRRQIAATRARWQGSDGPSSRRARGPASPATPSASPSTALPAREPAESGQIVAEVAGPLNLLRLHAGISPFRRLEVELGEPVAGQELRLQAEPAVVRPWELPLSGGFHQQLEPPILEPDPTIFPDDESIPGELRLQCWRAGSPGSTHNLWTSIEPADLWHATPGEEPVLAGLVTPNAPVLAALLSGLEGDVMAYRTPDGRRLRQELESVAEVVRGLGLRYGVASPAWGGVRGQRVATPDRVLASRRASCLDLAILWSSLLERLGFHPLIVLLEAAEPGSPAGPAPGHAICGVWTADIRSRRPVVRVSRVLEQMVGSGDLLLFDPTLPFAGAGDSDFSSALQAGRKALARRPVALDLAACRGRGLTPLPRRR